MKTALLVLVLLGAVSLTYSNHFENGFHFDDSHTVIDNPYIRSLKNAPLFFTDARSFSVLPANRTYRPLVPLSLAFDYWLANGLKPAYFQASTFFWYLVQLVLMFVLFRRICDLARPDPRNLWVALFATALYGLHPAMAETVNYVIQRGDLYSTLGVVSGVLVYAAFPGFRRYGLYLIPVAAAVLSKPPALIFPAILFVFIWLFEETKPLAALKRCVPALVVTGALGVLSVAMTPAGYTPGAVSALAYRMTQPLVALRYFRTFFIPDQLTADTDHVPVTGFFADYAWLGFVFVIAMVVVAVRLSARREWRPAAFGLWWFLLALIPTAVFPLAEVENDHRMFFPFAGLTLAVCWPVALWFYRKTSSGSDALMTRGAQIAVAAICVVVLAAYAAGTRQRNEVWRTDEALWADVTIKSPRNGRGLMNYGLTQMAKGESKRALDYFERALVFTPGYPVLETNLGIANGELHQDKAAELHLSRAIQLAPNDASGYYFYARWLQQRGRSSEAVTRLQQAIAVNPDYLAAHGLLMETSAQRGDWAGVKAAAASMLQRFPADQTAAGYLARAETGATNPTRSMTADDYLNASLSLHQARKFTESIEAAKQALKLRPNYAEAYNNIAAAYEGMEMWDQAIQAARKALELRPDFQLARNNLLWSEEQKRKSGARVGPGSPVTKQALKKSTAF